MDLNYQCHSLTYETINARNEIKGHTSGNFYDTEESIKILSKAYVKQTLHVDFACNVPLHLLI